MIYNKKMKIGEITFDSSKANFSIKCQNRVYKVEQSYFYYKDILVYHNWEERPWLDIPSHLLLNDLYDIYCLNKYKNY